MLSREAQIILQASAPATGSAFSPMRDRATYQAVLTTSSGTGTATVQLYVSNSPPVNGLGTNGMLMATITLSGASPQVDGFESVAPWKWVWAVVTSITGTGASVSVYQGV